MDKLQELAITHYENNKVNLHNKKEVREILGKDIYEIIRKLFTNRFMNN